jgi:hypothetical protein
LVRRRLIHGIDGQEKAPRSGGTEQFLHDLPGGLRRSSSPEGGSDGLKEVLLEVEEIQGRDVDGEDGEPSASGGGRRALLAQLEEGKHP